MTRWDVKTYSANLASGFPLAELGRFVIERSERIRPFEQPETTFRILGVNNEQGVFHAYDALGKTFNQPYQRVLAGDFFYNPYRVNVGSIGRVPDKLGGNYVSPAYVVFSVDPQKVDPRFLEIVMRAEWFNPSLRAQTAGSVRQNLTFELLRQLRIPLPPIDVQRVIVQRWQAAQAATADTEAHVQQVEKEIEAVFLSDLGIGQPTATSKPRCFAIQWRDLQRWSVRYTVDDLLSDDWFSNTFPTVGLGAVSTVSYGIQKSPANRPGASARPYLRVANVRRGYLDLAEIKEINVQDSEMAAYRLEAGDILFVEGNGSRAELGRVAMWNGEIPNCVHQNHLIKVRMDQARILPQYAMSWFNTEVGRAHFFRSAKTSSGLGTINSQEVRSAPIPLPPLDVQRTLLERVQAGRAEIARLRAEAEQMRRTAAQEVEAMILGTRPVPWLQPFSEVTAI